VEYVKALCSLLYYTQGSVRNIIRNMSKDVVYQIACKSKLHHISYSIYSLFDFDEGVSLLRI